MNLSNEELVLLDNIAYYNEPYDEYDEAKNISESFTVKSIVQGFKNGNYTTPID